MTQQMPEFQPGAILYEVLLGAFRARGTSLARWCREKGYATANVCNATLGRGGGKAARRYLAEAIAAAGREFVRDAYVRRIAEHYEQIRKGAG